MTTPLASKDPLPLTAVLLAGGQSRRMGSDKAQLEFEGQPLWRRQIALLESMQPAEIFVSGPRRPGFPDALRNVEDAGTNQGPLAGLATALRAAASPHVLVLAIDMPLMTGAFLAELRGRARPGRGVVPFLLERETREKFYEPLAAIYPRECVELVDRHLASADWSMQTLVRAGVSAGLLAEFEIPAGTRKCFANANTPGSLGRSPFERLLGLHLGVVFLQRLHAEFALLQRADAADAGLRGAERGHDRHAMRDSGGADLHLVAPRGHAAGRVDDEGDFAVLDHVEHVGPALPKAC